jgi:probable HAF family extracellular repeat protein
MTRQFVRTVATAALCAALGACGGDNGDGDGTPANQPPTAAFTMSPGSGLVPLTIAVDGRASADPDGTISTYAWDFGDGSAAASGATATHDYASVGYYTITLRVTDNAGTTASVAHSVTAMTDVAAEWYSVTEIPSLGGSYTEPRRINNRGEVTGYSYLANSKTEHAFLYSNGSTRDLGTLGGLQSYGMGLNDAGEVVGRSNVASAYHAFLYRAGTMMDLGTLGGPYSEAFGINDAGQVVGSSFIDSTSMRAFIRESGAMRSLGTLGGDYSVAVDVADDGTVAGMSWTTTNQRHLFLYRNGSMTDAGSGAAGFDLWAEAINDRTDVVGMWVPPQGYPGYTGFLYRDGVLRELVAGYSEPQDVNDAGVVVGYAHFGMDGHAFVWDATNGIQDLNTMIDPSLGLTLAAMQGINDIGQIVGHGYRTGSGQNVAVLLTPANPPPP